MNTKRKLILGTIGAISVMAVMIFSSIGASMWGSELYAIEQEIQNLEAENRKITDEIISSGSLSHVYENQEDLGYMQPADVLYLNRDTSVAHAQ